MITLAAVALGCAVACIVASLMLVAWVLRDVREERREILLLLATRPAVDVPKVREIARKRTTLGVAVGGNDPEATRNYRDDRRDPPPMVGLGNEQ